MNFLPQDHPDVLDLLRQLQAQYETIGKVSSFVGHTNVEYLRSEFSYDVQLVIQSGSMGRSRLENQGAELQEIASPEVRRQKLVEYQDEMRAFTAFLKECYQGKE